MASLSGLFEQVTTIRNRYWPEVKAEAYCRTATETAAAEVRTAEQKAALAGAKVTAMEALNAAVRVWR